MVLPGIKHTSARTDPWRDPFHRNNSQDSVLNTPANRRPILVPCACSLPESCYLIDVQKFRLLLYFVNSSTHLVPKHLSSLAFFPTSSILLCRLAQCFSFYLAQCIKQTAWREAELLQRLYWNLMETLPTKTSRGGISFWCRSLRNKHFSHYLNPAQTMKGKMKFLCQRT